MAIRLKFDGVNEIAVSVDSNQKVVHVLDLDNGGGQTVTNAIDRIYQPIMQKVAEFYPNLDLSKTVCFLYGTEGIVSEYNHKEDSFKFIYLEDRRVVKALAAEMKKRQEKN